MATVTKTIGTSSRDYSTITAWEADLDSSAMMGGIYSSGDDAIGECYNDSTFNERVVIDGGTSIGLSSVKLTVTSSDRHEGRAGTGVKIEYSGSTNPSVVLKRNDVTIEWLELDMSSAGSGVHSALNIGANADTNVFIKNNIIHSLTEQGGAVHGIYVWNSGSGSNTRYITNNLIYNLKDSNDDAYGIRVVSSNYPVEILNNTVYYVQTVSDTSSCFFIEDSDATLKNNIAARPTGSPSNSFSGSAFSSSTHDYNLSTDSTATGTNSVTGEDYGDLFVSTTEGTEDLHLKEGADAIGAGVDLGTSPTGVNIDIDGRDRDSEGDDWDIGADQYVASGGGGGGGGGGTFNKAIAHPITLPVARPVGRNVFEQR
tara:strand:+ start:1628 stop:2740 length:1113 start_codon:yes stop_codon:yes gene_type:complete